MGGCSAYYATKGIFQVFVPSCAYVDFTLYSSQINMAAVLDYQPGRAIPQIKMTIIFKQEEEGQPVDKYATLGLRGVHDQTSLRLMCTHHTATKG